jgi:hypothetical protein
MITFRSEGARRRDSLGALAALPLAAPLRAFAQSTGLVERIRREGKDHSQILRTIHRLSDLYGPRLTGSANARLAGEWAAGSCCGLDWPARTPES